MKIFASYSRKDIDIVKPIILALREKGLDIWFDQLELESGDDFANRTIANLRESSCVLFFHSTNSNDSQWSIREIGYAINLNKQIVVVKIDDSPLNSCMEFNLGATNFLLWSKDYKEASVQKILSVLKYKNPDMSGDCAPMPRMQSSPTISYTPGTSGKRGGFQKVVNAVIIIIGIMIPLMTFLWIPSPKFGSPCPESPCDKAESISSIEDSLTIEQPSLESVDGQREKGTSGIIRGTPNYKYYDDSYITLTLVVTFVITLSSVLIILYVISRKKKYKVKFGSAFPSKLNIDGKEIASLLPYKMHSEKMMTGHYLVDFLSQETNGGHVAYNLSVGKKQDNYLFVEAPKKEAPKFNHSNTIKVFIAGSLKLARERDALRSVISIMYNKWQSHDFRILSYTFEDFSNKFKPDGGQQSAYDDFIENEADWAVFVIDGQVGGITHDEFDKAMAAHKRTGEPNILVLSHRESEDADEIKEIRNQINKEHQYWTPYSTILEMKKEFESTLNWDLIEMIKK